MTSSRSSLLSETATRPLPAADARLRPALLARHFDLAALRYDFPLVLARAGDPPVESLSGIVDGLLRQLAPPGSDGERLRRQVLRLEREVRALAMAGTAGTLAELWQRATERLLACAEPDARAGLADGLAGARRALAVDGAVCDCGPQAPAAFMTHLWRAAGSARARPLAERIRRLVVRLRELLHADFLESPQARSAERLQRTFGAPYADLLDFQALSRTLDETARDAPLPERRRRRIRAALEVLETQRFVPLPAGGTEPYAFTFDGCAAAIEAFRSRLPEMAAVVRAVGIAELELDNRYRDAVHDPFFQRFGPSQLTPEELAWFPASLVIVRDAVPAERSAILDALSAGLPMKIVVQFDDILQEPPLPDGTPVFQRNRPQFARMAVGLDSVFVLQTASSHLHRMRNKVYRGMNVAAPALFCVYSGCGEGTGGLPPYLVAAAAVEARAFPLFAYDPTAGDEWAERFDVRDNPQPESRWPTHRFEYEGRDHRRIVESLPFTFADFAACDRRYAARLERISAHRAGAAAPAADAQASVPLVDEHRVLHRFAVDEGLLAATRRCADGWRSLQELGGIDSSHARRLLEQQRAAWERDRQKEAKTPASPGAAPAAAERPAAVPVAAAPAEVPAPGPSDEAWIETPRCTTCDECTRINNRLFAYNENKQAAIADINAGTYRELVEAAEACQVSIIHPGKPRNPAEPGLDELMRRAAPFQ